MFRRRRLRAVLGAQVEEGPRFTPITELTLGWPPAPDHMAEHAGVAVQKASQIDGVELDYSVQSLHLVDGLLGAFYDAGDDPGLMAETMFRFGAYIGEVMNRALGSHWVLLPEDHVLGARWPMIDLGGRLANPVGATIQRVVYGPPESIPFFYEAITAP